MVAITAFAVQTANAGVDNPHLSTDMDGFASSLWPPHYVDIGRRSQVSLTSNLPVSQTTATLTTFRARSFFDDYYNRIHITPRELNLGNVVSTQISRVYVWNAYVVARTLDAINGVATGMAVTGQPSPPMLFNPLAELAYDISVTPEGPAVLDAVVSWEFDNGEEPGVHITANRIVAWAFAPDWADGVHETLEWMTDILASESLAEQRRALRLAARRSLAAPMLIDGRERQLFDLAMFDWGARIWALPIWPDIQILTSPIALGAMRITCATQYLDFYDGGLAMLRGESAFDLEVVQIDGIDSTGIDLMRPTSAAWPVGTRLYPARPAQLTSEPDQTRLTDMALSAEVEFVIVEAGDWAAALPATLYRGYGVLEQKPDESEDITAQYSRLLATLDSGMSMPLITDVGGKAMPVRSWRWLGQGRAARAAFRSLLYALRGQQVPVWIPTHADDLTVTAQITGIATTIDVAYCGYTRFGRQRVGRRDIRIELVNGTAYHRRITGSTEVSTTVERLSIDSALGATIQPTQILRVCFMTLSRGSSDRVEIEHITDSEGIASCALTFRGVRDDDV